MGAFAEIPQRTLDEYETEARLTGRHVLVVEGGRDVAFYGDILLSVNVDITIVPVAAVETPEGGFTLGELVEGRYVEFGSRDRLIQLAEDYGAGTRVMFVADRDTDSEDDLRSDIPCLAYTDYPAVESYWITESNLRWFIRAFDIVKRSAGGRLDARRKAEDQALDDLLSCLARFLIPLYHLRRAHRKARSNQPFPSELGKFRTDEGFPDVGLNVAKICAQAGIEPVDAAERFSDGNFEIVRRHAYGHDVASALWAMFPRFRNATGLATQEDLEELLVAQVSIDDVIDSNLFGVLVAWA